MPATMPFSRSSTNLAPGSSPLRWPDRAITTASMPSRSPENESKSAERSCLARRPPSATPRPTRSAKSRSSVSSSASAS